MALTWVYDLPSPNWNNHFARGAASGWEWTGSYLFQSGQPVTIQSGVDSNGNQDAAGDRAILNAAGTQGVGSKVSRVCRDPATGATSVNNACATANTVGYVANTPNARYIQAGAGAIPNIGRNTFNSPYFNVWNMSIIKNQKLTERFKLQMRVDAYDVFNHPNYTFGNLSVFQVTTNALSQNYANLNTGSGFLDKTLFDGGSRIIQLGLKLTY